MTDLRELQDDDFEALLALCEATLPLDPWTLPSLRQHVRGEPDHDPTLQLALWDGERLIGAMLGGVRGVGDGRYGFLRLFAVDAAYRRRGHASMLLGALEDRMRGRGIPRVSTAGTHDYFWPGVDVRYTPAFCLLERHGWKRESDAVNMRVDLHARSWDTDTEEARLTEQGFTIRRLQAEDREAFGAWLGATWNPSWQHEGLMSYLNDPVSTFVATQEGQIVAFATYGVTPYLYGFGPTGTEPSLQGRGIGRVLFYRCMRDLHERGYPFSEVQWTGPISFYARIADAQIHRVFWQMKKEL
jgi:mycothiol synthase